MWQDLTQREKFDLIRDYIRQGYNDLDDIMSAYNGSQINEYRDGGYSPSKAIRNRIAAWEGSSMYAPAPDTGKVNNSFENEAAAFWSVLPKDIRGKMTQDMLDALYSTSYNIGAGNFKKRVVPALIKLYNGTGSVDEVKRSMYGTKDSDPKLPGLRKRREIERQLFEKAWNASYNGGFKTGMEDVTWEDVQARKQMISTGMANNVISLMSDEDNAAYFNQLLDNTQIDFGEPSVQKKTDPFSFMDTENAAQGMEMLQAYNNIMNTDFSANSTQQQAPQTDGYMIYLG
jgi:hypothetical protein